MSKGVHDEKERCRQLMMALLDGEISESDREELQILLNKFPDLKDESSEFSKLKEVTQKMKFKEPDPDVWQTYWYNIYNRMERGVAWLIFAIGAGILLAYGLYTMVLGLWQATDMPAVIKVGIFVVLLGVIMLLLSVAREKLFLWRHERYKEVQR